MAVEGAGPFRKFDNFGISSLTLDDVVETDFFLMSGASGG